MTLPNFTRRLETLIGRPSTLRPFVCEGSPLACPIFLVGFNPATSSEVDFWRFWREGYGYDKRAWFAHYLAERAAQPLKPGRIRRQRVSATRRNIEHLVAGAGAVGVLETNIYAAASADMRSLGASDRDTAPFRFLVEAIRPKVIVVHGRKAAEALAGIGPGAKVIAVPHLSRGVSGEMARGYGAIAAGEAG